MAHTVGIFLKQLWNLYSRKNLLPADLDISMNADTMLYFIVNKPIWTTETIILEPFWWFCDLYWVDAKAQQWKGLLMLTPML